MNLNWFEDGFTISYITSKWTLHRYFVNKISFPSSLFCIVYMALNQNFASEAVWSDKKDSSNSIFGPTLFIFNTAGWKQPIRNSLGEFHGSAALAGYKWFSFSVLKIWSYLVVAANKTMFPSISSPFTARLWDTQDTPVILWSSFVLFIPNQTQRKMALHIMYIYVYLYFSSCFFFFKYLDPNPLLFLASSKVTLFSKVRDHQLIFQFIHCI